MAQLDDGGEGGIMNQISGNSNSNHLLQEKIAKLEKRIAGCSPSSAAPEVRGGGGGLAILAPQIPATSAQTEVTGTMWNLPKPSRLSFGGSPADDTDAASPSDSDDEGAEEFSIQPNPRKRKMFEEDQPDTSSKQTKQRQRKAETKSPKAGRGRGGRRGRGRGAAVASSRRRGSGEDFGVTTPVSDKACGGTVLGGPSPRLQGGTPGADDAAAGSVGFTREAVSHLEELLAQRDAEWRAERQRLAEEQERLHAMVLALEAEVSREQHRAEDCEKQTLELDNRLKREKEIHEVREQKRLKALSDLVVSIAGKERQVARERVMQDTARLGHIGIMRAGTMLTEKWEDGPVFADIDRRLKSLLVQKEVLDKMRKQAQTRNKRGTSPTTSDLGGDSRDGLETSDRDEWKAQQEELYKIKMLGLKREEEAAYRDRDRHEMEKARHIREMKRIRDEDASSFNNFRLMNKRYILLNLLGKGGFSEVYKAFDLVECHEVACKLHQLNVNWSEEKKKSYVTHAMREYHIHKKLNHPRIVRLIDIFEIDNNTFGTVLEYCDGKDLDFMLKMTPVLSEREARSIIVQVFSALVYLNQPEHRVIHYDLKPGNILIDSAGEVKITDFGLSKVMEDAVGSQGMELTSQGAGTYWYLPPECFEVKKTPLISSKVDVWSAGVVFFQMLFGFKPFGRDQTQERILREDTILNAKQVRFPDKPAISSQAKEFILRCLTYDQRLRPEVVTVAKDPYLTYAKKKA